MWAPTSCVFFGLWLMASPLIFHIPDEYSRIWWSEIVLGSLIIFFGLLSCSRKWEAVRFINCAIAAISVLYGYFFFPHPRLPIAQNHILIGLLLLMFSIIPLWPSFPPPSSNGEKEKE